MGLIGRDLSKLRALQDDITGVQAVRRVDMDHSLSKVGETITELCNEMGNVNAVVSTHGHLNMSALRSSSVEQWESAIRVNLLSNVEILKAFREHIVGSNSVGKVVFFSSVASSRGSGGLSAYSATKSAVESLVRSAAVEFARDKILVNSIQLGLLESGMGLRIQGLIGSDRFSNIKNSYPLGLGGQTDAFGAVSFLLSEQSNWITGTNLLVDGGYSAV